jgi:hypothetical protein
VGAGTSRRATQTIPPAVRREVLRRHDNRCAVPGCTNHQFLDIHRVVPRKEGGTHDPDGLIALCGTHHRAHHAGALHVTGTATTTFSFRHADGTAYGGPLRPAAVDVAQQVHAMLTGLGFQESQARALVAAAQRAGAPACVEELLRAALRAS